MALTDAERARNYRARKREARGIVATMPVAEHEAFKEQARQLLEQYRALIAGLEAENAELREDLEKVGKRCATHGREKLCPDCTRGDYYE